MMAIDHAAKVIIADTRCIFVISAVIFVFFYFGNLADDISAQDVCTLCVTGAETPVFAGFKIKVEMDVTKLIFGLLISVKNARGFATFYEMRWSSSEVNKCCIVKGC